MLDLTLAAKWNLVGDYYNYNADLCGECFFCNKTYYSDTGWDYACELLQGTLGDPEECEGFGYMVELLEEELTDHD